MKVDIILPVLNAADFVRTCVKSLFECTPVGLYQLYIADDGSTDKALLGFYDGVAGTPSVVVRRNERRTGFPANCNTAAALGRNDITLFLNSDTVLSPGWLEPILAEFAGDQKVGIVGSRLLFPVKRWECAAGTIQHAGVARNGDGLPYHIFRGCAPDHPKVMQRREINAVTGACLATRRSLWTQVGGFDERFLYGQFEDIDYCWMVRSLGYKVVYQPNSVLHHYEHGSGEQYVAQTADRNRVRLIGKWGNLGSDEHLFE